MTQRTAEQEALHAWLAERALDMRLSQEDAPPPATEPLVGDFSNQAMPARGQIRLLAPHLAPSPTPRYVGVSEVDAHTATLVPFSRYALPALPGEYSTGIESCPLRVACPWMAIQVDVTTVTHSSWFSGTLGAHHHTELDQALNAFRTGLRPPPGLLARTGPRLIHPHDPRHLYLEEERTFTVSVREHCTSHTGSHLRLYETPLEETALLKAAESRIPYGRALHLSIAGTSLRLCRRDNERPSALRIEDPEAQLSHHFDGSWLCDAEGHCSSPFWDGKAQVSAALTETATHLTRPEGMTHRLRGRV